MSPLSDRTHKPHATDPTRFRAIATGIGASVKESLATGMARMARVAACAPAPGDSKPPVSRGY